MKSSTTFKLCLRSLSHPLNLLAITVLLLNDHFLKVHFPSFITGKLSDFAGLFFFPFLLAIFIGIPLERFGIRPRQIGKLAFLMTILWFTAIKTSVGANHFMERFLELFLGSAQIIRDPTDLLAISSLWPAWSLWKREEASSESDKNRMRFSYLPLGLAAFATMATSCPPVPEIRRLAVDNNNIYLSSEWGGYFTSTDGLNWAQIWDDELPMRVYEQLQQDVRLPLTLCLPDDQQVCFRITGDEQVEESTDGGKTWEVVWKIPLGRRRFMERHAGGGIFGLCGKSLTPGPFDMAVLDSHGSQVLFAAGNEGLLIRNENGTFSRHEVAGAQPTPYAELNVALIIGEGIIGFIVSLFAMLLSSTMGWNQLLNESDVDPEAIVKKKWSLWLAIGANVVFPFIGYLILTNMSGNSFIFLIPTFLAIAIISIWNLALRRYLETKRVRAIRTMLFLYLFAAMVLGVSPIYSYLESYRMGANYIWLFYPNIVILLISIMMLTWSYFKNVFEVQIARTLQKISWQTGILSLLGAWIPFLLWTIGLVPIYEVAFAMGSVSVMAVLIWAWKRITAQVFKGSNE